MRVKVSPAAMVALVRTLITRPVGAETPKNEKSRLVAGETIFLTFISYKYRLDRHGTLVCDWDFRVACNPISECPCYLKMISPESQFTVAITFSRCNQTTQD